MGPGSRAFCSLSFWAKLSNPGEGLTEPRALGGWRWQAGAGDISPDTLVSPDHLPLPKPLAAFRVVVFRDVVPWPSCINMERASSLQEAQLPAPAPPVSFLPGRAGSRWPGFQVTVSLRTTVPGRQSGRSALMCTQAHICLAHAPTQQALCDKPPAVPRPGVSGGCLGKSEGFGPAFLEMLYLQTLCLASASQSSINCSITPSKQL